MVEVVKGVEKQPGPEASTVTTVTSTSTSPASDPDPEAVIDAAQEEVEVEAARQRAAEQEVDLERWALRTRDESGTEIERLHTLLDRADERDRKHAQRHREAVATINAGLKREQAKDRKLRDVCDAHLTAPLCACGSGAVHDAELLARFFAVQRKAPAA